MRNPQKVENRFEKLTTTISSNRPSPASITLCSSNGLSWKYAQSIPALAIDKGPSIQFCRPRAEIELTREKFSKCADFRTKEMVSTHNHPTPQGFLFTCHRASARRCHVMSECLRPLGPAGRLQISEAEHIRSRKAVQACSATYDPSHGLHMLNLHRISRPQLRWHLVSWTRSS